MKKMTYSVFWGCRYFLNCKLLEGISDMDDRGYIRTDRDVYTNLLGVYVAEDIRIKSLR